MIGIIGAMDIEIDRLLKDLKNKKIEKVAFLEVYLGTLYSKEVVIAKSNEGKVNSAIATQLLISNFNVNCIINAGVAGAVDNSLQIFDIAISSNTVEFDQDVTALGYDKGYTFGLDKVYINASKSLSYKLDLICKRLKINSKIGTICSSDKFVVDKKEKEMLKNNFNAIAVDMESASINHVACLNDIPFVSFRVISDSGNNIEYSKFANGAVEKISIILSELFKEDML